VEDDAGDGRFARPGSWALSQLGVYRDKGAVPLVLRLTSFGPSTAIEAFPLATGQRLDHQALTHCCRTLLVMSVGKHGEVLAELGLFGHARGGVN
jgi:hypothetical protein